MTLASFCITKAIQAPGHQPMAGTADIYLVTGSCVKRTREKTEGLTDFTRILSKLFYFTLENLIWKKTIFTC